MKGERIMKKNTGNQAENREKRIDDGLYTIYDRYMNFCDQAHINSGRVEWKEKYISGWFVY